MRYSLAGALLALLITAPARGDDSKALAPFLDDLAFAVVRLDLGKIALPKLIDRLTADVKKKPAYLTLLAKDWSATVERLVKDGATVVYVVASLRDVPDDYPFVVVPLREGADAEKLTRQLGVLKQFDPTFAVSRIGEALVAGSSVALKRLQTLKPVPRIYLIDGLGKAAPPARLVIGRTADASRILEETMPELPREVGGGSTQPLSQGLQWVRVDIDSTPRFVVRLTIQTRDAGMAEALNDMVRRVLGSLAKNKDVAAVVPEVAKLAGLWKPRTDGGRLVLMLDETTIAETLRPHVEQALLTAQLRRLVGAMIEHSERRGTFPAQASYDKAGKPLLSWRVHLLPFLGEEALYKEFKLGEAWDSPHNKTLLAKMPRVYLPLFGEAKEPYSTHYQIFTGPNTPFPIGQKQGPRLASFRDGLRNTVLVIEAGEAVPWTKPIDLAVDAKKPLPKLGATPGSTFFGAMADGTLQRFRPDFDAQTMRWVIDPADAQVLYFDKVSP